MTANLPWWSAWSQREGPPQSVQRGDVLRRPEGAAAQQYSILPEF